MHEENTILTNYGPVAGVYSTKELLEKNNFIPLDNNKNYYAKIRDKTFLEIWRTMGDCKIEEDFGCMPIYGTYDWNPHDEYTKPFNKKIRELYQKEGIEFE